MSKTKILNLDMMSLQNIDEDSDLIPLMTSDDEEAISKESLPEKLPILPLKITIRSMCHVIKSKKEIFYLFRMK